ncbi:hypothetical protein [Lichenibacterium dinghuense]|uniref:hypothetical protein n=1 Tax=Lichenibacterium dinghuense TaxID=2895977 RepID=UPI001F202A84|nr:hypothetical protein [Lichenibacterium sp. 6Y81]
MVQHSPADPLDAVSDDRLSFTDVTLLAFLAVSAVVLAALLLLGAVSAEHRIAAVLGQW